MNIIQNLIDYLIKIRDISFVFYLAIKTVLHNSNNSINSKSINKNYIEIRIYGNHIFKREMVGIYTLGNFDDEILTIDEDFYKIIEIHNEIRKLIFNFSFPQNYMIHMQFLFGLMLDM